MMPPACNTGVHPPSPSPLVSRFDWYRATVPAHHKIVIDACADMAGPSAQVLIGKGRFNYTNSATVLVGSDRVATVLYGGSNGHPNVEASGDRAPALAMLLRASGAHKVTRCDVAVDLFGDNLFSDLEGVALGIASKFGVGVRKIGNPLDKTAGETIYLGSRKSAVFARIYEKGKADSRHYVGTDIDSDPALLYPWVRCELEIKPQKAMKEHASKWSPETFWGVSDWTAQLAHEVTGMSVERIDFHPRRHTTDDMSFSWMCSQYRNLLHRRLRDQHDGDIDALLQEIRHKIFDEQEHQNAA